MGYTPRMAQPLRRRHRAVYWRSLAWATLAGVALLGVLLARHEAPPLAHEALAARAAPRAWVGMAAPVYIPPFDAAVRAPAGGDAALRLLAPPHLARTVSASPLLYWWLGEPPSAAARCRLVLAAEGAREPFFAETLPPPVRSGLQQVVLADLGAELPEGVPMRWTIELDATIASGWIERVPASAQLTADLAAARPLDRASVYAAAGIWHEALAELEHVVHVAPKETLPLRHLHSLLASAGIDGAKLQP
jgi:hypothetical protein